MLDRLLEPKATVNQMRSILGKISEGILFVLLDGTVTEANEAAQKILKMQAIEGKRFWDVLPDDYFGFSMRESLRYGISYGLIYRHGLEITTSFFYEGPQGLFIKIQDITERQKILTMLKRVDRMKELGEWAAKLAHEIRNALGGIRGFSTLLYRDLAGEPHLQDMISKVIEGTKSLEKLVTSVLVYARPDEIAVQTLDLSLFLRQVAKFIKVDPAIPSNVKLRQNIPDAPILAPFDPDALKRCLINLLINGSQAMPEGGELTLSLFKVDSMCQITVADTGIGMSEEQMASLFAPLFTTKKMGNGLGLVEAKKIVNAHGGTIEVRSNLGRGTTFFITLPVKL